MQQRVAVVQLRSTEDIDANLAVIGREVREARDAGATFIALPENAPFLRTTPAGRAPMQPLDGELIGWFRELAAEVDAWLLVGSYPETGPDADHYYNTSVVIDGTRAGAPVTASYRKLHLFDIDVKGGESQRESDYIAPGDQVVCTPIAGVQVGLSICYDLRFPRLYQRLADLGAEALTVPAAFTEFTGKDHWLPLLRARAIETQTFVIAPNQWGHHGGKRRSYGKSCIIDPWGIPLVVCPDRVSHAVATVDLDHLEEIRASLPCAQHRHPAV